jgi:hypothetical protein
MALFSITDGECVDQQSTHYMVVFGAVALANSLLGADYQQIAGCPCLRIDLLWRFFLGHVTVDCNQKCIIVLLSTNRPFAVL